ncbi:ApeI family dehydratase [Gallaecimonas mangrovi]|uniref:ApeI family dehydratase n=1 Tax=Gallaecimonas mangrovi TaxID=2291597 RepID=UPI000E202BE9|nr:thioester dehydrase [Gallaecimonas mangrovi]
MLTLPEVVERHLTEQGLELVLEMDPKLAYFQGHFPELPILPGVAQLDWAARFGAEHFGLTLKSQRMEAVKFQALVVPGLQLHLRLQYDDVKGRLLFSYHSVRGNHASGRILMAKEAR